MLAYYGYAISPNQIETGEGFLICRNVPIARIGDQEYLGRETGLSGADADRLVTVTRPPEEVFSDAALASFEGKPVTNDHPPGLVGPDDVAAYEKGHAQNIRQGSGEWESYVLADLHIHDRELIDAIQNGKREISCGYECEYVPNNDGTYSQKNIRGNHIAVVDRGRAGKRAAILDSAQKPEKARRPERKAMKKKGLIFSLFGQAVKDKSPEEIEQLAMDAADALEEQEEAAPAKEETKGDEKKEAADESAVDAVVEKVLAKLAEKKEKEGKAEDSLDAAIMHLSGDGDKKEEGAADEEARVVPAEGQDKACGMDRAIAAGILKAMRPSVAAIRDEAQRKAVSDALISLVTAGEAKDDIVAVLETSKKNAQRAAEGKCGAVDYDAIQALYDNLNPHRRKENQS